MLDKIASILTELDTIASDLQQDCPRVALELDKISDTIEVLAAKDSLEQVLKDIQNLKPPTLLKPITFDTKAIDEAIKKLQEFKKN